MTDQTAERAGNAAEAADAPAARPSEAAAPTAPVEPSLAPAAASPSLPAPEPIVGPAERTRPLLARAPSRMWSIVGSVTADRRLPVAAGVAAAMALGTILGAGATLLLQRADRGATAAVAAMGADLRRVATRLDAAAGERADAGRVNVDLRALREQVASLREITERGRQDAVQRFTQVGDRFDKLNKVEQETGAKLAAVVERLDRGDREQAARLAQLGERLDKRPVAPSPTTQAVPAAARPTDTPTTGSLPEAAKPKVVEGWILREVYDGVAMLEGRNQRLYEVGPGETLPGVGRVEAIERRGKNWVVVTSRGVIVPPTWWTDLGR